MSGPTAYSSDWLGVTDLPAWVPGVRRPARPVERARATRAEGTPALPRGASLTAADPGEIDRRAALLGLLAQDLARGHQRLAIRHYLMLVSLGSPVPAGFSQRCEALVAACPPERLARIRADVASWRVHNRRSAAASGDGFDLRLLEA